jgi:hypothetical protein
MDRETWFDRVDQANKELHRRIESVPEARDELIRIVRDAHHAGGVPMLQLAKHLGMHRNTIAGWCKR